MKKIMLFVVLIMVLALGACDVKPPLEIIETTQETTKIIETKPTIIYTTTPTTTIPTTNYYTIPLPEEIKVDDYPVAVPFEPEFRFCYYGLSGFVMDLAKDDDKVNKFLHCNSYMQI